MKRKLITLLLVVAMLTSAVSVSAATTTQINTADAMNELGLFLGDGTGYNLSGKLTRAQGVTLLVRMLGKEAEVSSGTYVTPFKDVPSWAKGYIGYAWKNKITKGTSTTTFGTDDQMTDYMFLTLTLRALGYSDSGANAKFTWDQPYALAKEVGLIQSAAADKNFTRADAIMVFWYALKAEVVGTGKTLSETLIEQGVITEEEMESAEDTQENGREENSGVPIVPDDSQSGSTDDTTEDTPENNPTELTYEEYLAMTPEEQDAFFDQFDSFDAFSAWLSAAKAEYDKNKEEIEVGSGGSIDLGDVG